MKYLVPGPPRYSLAASFVVFLTISNELSNVCSFLLNEIILSNESLESAAVLSMS